MIVSYINDILSSGFLFLKLSTQNVPMERINSDILCYPQNVAKEQNKFTGHFIKSIKK